MSPTRSAWLIENLESARAYTLRLLAEVDPADWFRMPPGGVTHVAWQVGHLAVAEYRLALMRLRGPHPDDAALLPPGSVERFGYGSVPVPDPGAYPGVSEIRDALDRVHRAAIEHARTLSDADLDAPPAPPAHVRFTTRAGALLWCGQHEFLHAGQIGLLRRLLGAGPLA